MYSTRIYCYYAAFHSQLQVAGLKAGQQQASSAELQQCLLTLWVGVQIFFHFWLCIGRPALSNQKAITQQGPACCL